MFLTLHFLSGQFNVNIQLVHAVNVKPRLETVDRNIFPESYNRSLCVLQQMELNFNSRFHTNLVQIWPEFGVFRFNIKDLSVSWWKTALIEAHDVKHFTKNNKTRFTQTKSPVLSPQTRLEKVMMARQKYPIYLQWNVSASNKNGLIWSQKHVREMFPCPSDFLVTNW